MKRHKRNLTAPFTVQLIFKKLLWQYIFKPHWLGEQIIKNGVQRKAEVLAMAFVVLEEEGQLNVGQTDREQEEDFLPRFLLRNRLT